MNDDQKKINEAVDLLRSLGCAVAVWQPEEIPGAADSSWLETLMVAAGAEYLSEF